MPDNTGGIFDSATLTTVVKWIVTILIIGFITQFGRKLANVIMDRAAGHKKRRAIREAGGAGTTPLSAGTGRKPAAAIRAAAEKARYKLEKKETKTLEKMKKKNKEGD